MVCVAYTYYNYRNVGTEFRNDSVEQVFSEVHSTRTQEKIKVCSAIERLHTLIRLKDYTHYFD